MIFSLLICCCNRVLISEKRKQTECLGATLNNNNLYFLLLAYGSFENYFHFILCEKQGSSITRVRENGSVDRWQCVDRIIFNSKETEGENLCKTLKNTPKKQQKKKNETEESEERKRATKKPESALQKLQPSRMRETYALDFRFNAEKWKTREQKKKEGKFNNENGKLFFKKPNYCCCVYHWM